MRRSAARTRPSSETTPTEGGCLDAPRTASRPPLLLSFGLAESVRHTSERSWQTLRLHFRPFPTSRSLPHLRRRRRLGRRRAATALPRPVAHARPKAPARASRGTRTTHTGGTATASIVAGSTRRRTAMSGTGGGASRRAPSAGEDARGRGHPTATGRPAAQARRGGTRSRAERQPRAQRLLFRRRRPGCRSSTSYTMPPAEATRPMSLSAPCTSTAWPSSIGQAVSLAFDRVTRAYPELNRQRSPRSWECRRPPSRLQDRPRSERFRLERCPRRVARAQRVQGESTVSHTSPCYQAD